jgi:hypothetical protein
MTSRDNLRGGPVTVLLAFALVVVGSEARAQSRVELSAYGVLDDVRLDAAQTLKAVSEPNYARVFGGGVQVTLRIQPLGVPLEVRMLYVDAVADRAGPPFLTGVDVALSRLFRVGGELRYRRTGGVLGPGGASARFDKDSASGVRTAIRVSIGLSTPGMRE